MVGPGPSFESYLSGLAALGKVEFRGTVFSRLSSLRLLAAGGFVSKAFVFRDKK